MLIFYNVYKRFNIEVCWSRGNYHQEELLLHQTISRFKKPNQDLPNHIKNHETSRISMFN